MAGKLFTITTSHTRQQAESLKIFSRIVLIIVLYVLVQSIDNTLRSFAYVPLIRLKRYSKKLFPARSRARVCKVMSTGTTVTRSVSDSHQSQRSTSMMEIIILLAIVFAGNSTATGDIGLAMQLTCTTSTATTKKLCWCSSEERLKSE